FPTAVLVDPHGLIVGTYRQTHIDPGMQGCCATGSDLSVFDTEIGRVGLLLNEDSRFPEASGVLAVRRADLIALCTRWDGSYGGYLHDAAGLFADQYPTNTMCLWYAIAKTSQAYTIVANAVDDGAQGSSGIFTLNPVDSTEPPVVAPVDTATAVTTEITTLGDPSWWMNQHRLIGGRRPDLAVPVMLPIDSPAFQTWQSKPGWNSTGWSAYVQ
ncbi:MAG: carbon-nitrogen hydrolase family protein, partial [Actinomycetales bacterium]